MREGNKKSRAEYREDYNKKNKVVKITFKNSDYEVIEKIADKQGLAIASFIRLATIEQAKNLYLFPKDIEDEIKKAVHNMRGIGNNINQIAKYANEQNYTSPESMEVIFNYLLRLEEEVHSVKKIITQKS